MKNQTINPCKFKNPAYMFALKGKKILKALYSNYYDSDSLSFITKIFIKIWYVNNLKKALTKKVSGYFALSITE